ncbi:uncharacterized protein LOC115992418 [Quercus lobata]|uniref:uncharacterized protein LOC115992418 n=1 Tax=Quercus lobata TaxID=97700 RepID=UPI001248A52A|nr:uncharacterized protein LOC115992418 [Quercus lobata]
MGGHSLVEISLKWLEGLSSGKICKEVETITMEGLKVVHGQKGFIRCHFLVPSRLADKDGNWHVGAMATLIDNVGAATIFSSIGLVKASVELNISYYSTAKIQEEVEIEAKVVADKEILTSVVVEVRKKDNGELIALGKQWMATLTLKVKLGEMSKL